MDADVRAELDALNVRIAELEARLAAVSAAGVDSAPGWSQREFGAAVNDPEVIELLRAGRKIEAIKAYRDRTGEGLAKSKDAVDEIERRLGL